MINPSTSYTIPFVTMAAGVPTDAASTPTAVVWRNGSAEATSVTVSTTSNTGIYHAAFTTGSGWAKTDRIWLVISATISSVAYRGIVWDSFSEPDAVMRGTDGANTTTPPTAAAIADTTLSGLTSGPTTGGNWPNGSFGRRILVGSSTQREVAVTGSNHVAADVHEFQTAVITSADFATDAISSDAVSSGAVGKIVTGVWSALTSGLSVVGSTGRALARLIGLVQDSSGDRFTAKALEMAPSGTGGDATEAKQDQIISLIQGSEVLTVASPNVRGNLVLTQGDTYDGLTGSNPKATWTVTTDYTSGWSVVLTIRDKNDAVVYTNTGTVPNATTVTVPIVTPTVTPFEGCPGVWQGKYDVQLTKSTSKKTIAIGVVYINEDQTRS